MTEMQPGSKKSRPAGILSSNIMGLYNLTSLKALAGVTWCFTLSCCCCWPLPISAGTFKGQCPGCLKRAVTGPFCIPEPSKQEPPPVKWITSGGIMLPLTQYRAASQWGRRNALFILKKVVEINYLFEGEEMLYLSCWRKAALSKAHRNPPEDFILPLQHWEIHCGFNPRLSAAFVPEGHFLMNFKVHISNW